MPRKSNEQAYARKCEENLARRAQQRAQFWARRSSYNPVEERLQGRLKGLKRIRDARDEERRERRAKGLWSVKEIADGIGIGSQHIYQFLRVYGDSGIVPKDGDGHYELGPRQVWILIRWFRIKPRGTWAHLSHVQLEHQIGTE